MKGNGRQSLSFPFRPLTINLSDIESFPFLTLTWPTLRKKRDNGQVTQHLIASISFLLWRHGHILKEKRQERPCLYKEIRVTSRRISFLSLIKNCNHKGLGIYYLLSAFIFGISGTLISVLIRIELYSSGNRIISPENQNFYNILLSLHGIIMIFFLVMPGLFGGIGNYFVPIFHLLSFFQSMTMLINLYLSINNPECYVLKFPYSPNLRFHIQHHNQ